MPVIYFLFFFLQLNISHKRTRSFVLVCAEVASLVVFQNQSYVTFERSEEEGVEGDEGRCKL